MHMAEDDYDYFGDKAYWETPRGKLVSICMYGNISSNAEDIVDDLIANANLLDEEVRNPTKRPYDD